MKRNIKKNLTAGPSNGPASRFTGLTTISLFCALTVSISQIESYFLFIPFLPFGLKPGFANVITMFVSVQFGLASSILIVCIKSAFTAFFRGGIAFLMSFFAGILSTLVTGILGRRQNLPYTLIGIIGSIVHNITQTVVASFLVGNVIYTYIPVLIFFSIITGSLTGYLLKMLSLKNFNR